MRYQALVIFAVALAFGQTAKADSVYGYALGVSLQNTVAPGSLVTINAVLLNTGSAPINFAPSFPGGLPSAQGGSAPFAGVSAGGDWSILDNGFSFGDFYGQFAGVTVAPGEEFQFSMGTFQAPTNQPLGSSAMPQINFGIDFTDAITGDLLVGCKGTCTFNNAPDPSFTLGNAPSNSAVTFFSGMVVDTTPVSVPEPSLWELFGVSALIMVPWLLRGFRRAEG